MDFKRLDYFIRVAELGSLSRAADRIRVAQPALSRQIRLLEQEIGVSLFDRHRRGMHLTKEGEEFRSRIVGPMRQIEQVTEDIQAKSQERGSSRVALGIPPTTSYVLSGPLTRRLAQQAPNISLRVVEGYTDHLMDWLQRGEIDLALLYGPASDYHLLAEDLLIEDLMLVGPPGSGLSEDEAVPFSELAEFPLVLPSHVHSLRVVLEKAAAKTKCKLNVLFEADSFHLMKDLVGSGSGYTVLPYSSFSREAEAGLLNMAPIRNPHLVRQLFLGTQRGTESTRAIRNLTLIIRQEIAALVDMGKWRANLLFNPKPNDLG